MRNDDFLGTGWSFPPTFREGRASGVDMVSGKEDINQSLGILLSTTLGERVLQTAYGCNLAAYQLEPMSSQFVGVIRDLVETAILYYEPRIKTKTVTISPADGQDAFNGNLLIEVSYLIRATNSRSNYVYPFYREEGTTI